MPSFAARRWAGDASVLAASALRSSLFPLMQNALSANAGLAAVWEGGRLSQVSSTAQDIAFTQDHGSLDYVLQLTDISRQP